MPRFPSNFPSAHFNFTDMHFGRLHLDRVRAHDADVAATMSSELCAALDTDENIVMVATEGARTFTFVAVPQQVLDNEPGPRLLPSSDPKIVLLAVAIEVLGRKADDCLATIDPREAELKWRRMWDWYFERALEVAKNQFASTIPDVVNPE